MSMKRYLKCLKLNCRMVSLVLRNRWLGKDDYAASYDKVAATYDAEWLARLCPVTTHLLESLPSVLAGDILDLGCGTGYSTAWLEERFPEHSLLGVDISQNMLEAARCKCIRAEFVQGDILDIMRKRPAHSASLIFSGWAIGYSKPELVIKEARRLLKPGGVMAFVVNYFDTLRPVFQAFSFCMNEYPDMVNLALWPKFPRSKEDLLQPFKQNHFNQVLQQDGEIPITAPNGTRPTLDWLLKTGVLAGFDHVMPLHDNQALAACFDRALSASADPVAHHYFSGIFLKTD
jgi:SAM-dependent methyltransferase